MTNIRKHTTVILLSLVALILMPLAAPVVADSPKVVQGTHPAIGTKVRVSPTTELTLLAVEDNKYTWNAKIEPRTTLDSGAAIDPMWHYVKDRWVAGANLFAAEVSGRTVTVSHNGESKTWTPTVTLSDKLLFILPNDKVLASPVTATLLPVDPWNEYYYGNTLQWTYGDGITRNVRLIEGLIQEYYTVDKPLDVDLVITANLAKSKDYTWTRPLVAWDADNTPVALIISGDTATLPKGTDATYPITIDPDSSFVTSASDGYIPSDTYWTIANETAFAIAWNETAPENIRDAMTSVIAGIGTQYVAQFYRAFLFFDTSSLGASADVTNATVVIRTSDNRYTNNMQADDNVRIISGMPTYPHDPIVSADYARTNYNTTTLSSIPGSSILYKTDAVYSFYLNSAGLDSIAVEGTTKFRVATGRDIGGVFNSTATFSCVGYYTYEKGTGYWPYLNVTYSAAVAPVASTVAATNIGNSTARVNAYINSSGGELCDVRFQYGTGTGNYTVNTAWVNDTYNTGAYPYADLTGLASVTEYFYRVQAANNQGSYNGTELSFTTESGISEPTNFKALAAGNDVSLSWTKGVGATTTVVRGKIGAYPTGVTDGTSVYADIGTTASHNNLLVGTTYYYSAWGASGGVYSDNATHAFITAGFPTSETDIPPTPNAPESWWTASDSTKLAQLPLYAEVNDLIADYGVAQSTGWTLMIISVVLILTAGVFAATTGNVIVTGLAFGTLCTGLSLLRLLPLWMMGLGIITFISIGIMRERI